MCMLTDLERRLPMQVETSECPWNGQSSCRAYKLLMGIVAACACLDLVMSFALMKGGSVLSNSTESKTIWCAHAAPCKGLYEERACTCHLVQHMHHTGKHHASCARSVAMNRVDVRLVAVVHVRKAAYVCDLWAAPAEFTAQAGHRMYIPGSVCDRTTPVSCGLEPRRRARPRVAKVMGRRIACVTSFTHSTQRAGPRTRLIVVQAAQCARHLVPSLRSWRHRRECYPVRSWWLRSV